MITKSKIQREQNRLTGRPNHVWSMSESQDNRSDRQTPSWVLPLSAIPSRASLSTTSRDNADDSPVARLTDQSPNLLTKRRLFDSVDQQTPPYTATKNHSAHVPFDEDCEWPMTWKSSLAVFSQLTEHLRECADKKMLNRSSCAFIFSSTNQLFATACCSLQERMERAEHDALTKSKQEFNRKLSSVEDALKVEKKKRQKIEDKYQQMKCPICFIPYLAPEHKQFCVMQCGHIICEDCLSSLRAASAVDDRDATCPSCRGPVLMYTKIYF